MDPELEKNWGRVLRFIEDKTGSPPDMQAVIFLVGARELGITDRKFKKDEKLNLMHIAICRLLEPYGYYSFKGNDADGWPHYDCIKELPPLDEREQQELMKRALVSYFAEEGIIGYAP
jgi:hypothetical protein